jgi:NAD(P)-dependent dehydrogenase (short-subunit alcohol dehydrogenase family)
VTGAGSGIGRAIARRLAADGLGVAVVDLEVDAAHRVADEIALAGGRAVPVAPLDVADRRQVEEGATRAAEQLDAPLLVLVNNAGRTGFGPFLRVDLDEWHHMMRVNLDGPFHCAQVLLPSMIDAGWGRIVNISSSSAQGGQPFMVPYVTTKAGLIGFTKALALEFGPKGITVNTIPPGFIDTPMLRASESQGKLGGTVEEHAARTPVRRVGRPEDIAAACAFLVSDEAGYITGQVIGVNGGRNTG